jgi:hypothetical protein
MFAVIAGILFLIGWLLNGIGGSAKIPVWFDWRGLLLLGLASLCVHLYRSGPWYPWRRVQ